MTTLGAIMAMLVSSSSPAAVPASELGPAILHASLRHNVDPHLLTRIVLVESRGVATAYNSKTKDHGLLQVNEATRKAYGISKWCLKIWQCNLDAGARILADMYAMPGARPCVFNIGPKGRFEKYATTCESYERKLASF